MGSEMCIRDRYSTFFGAEIKLFFSRALPICNPRALSFFFRFVWLGSLLGCLSAMKCFQSYQNQENGEKETNEIFSFNISKLNFAKNADGGFSKKSVGRKKYKYGNEELSQVFRHLNTAVPVSLLLGVSRELLRSISVPGKTRRETS